MRQSKTDGGDELSMDDTEQAFHDSFKMSWGPNGTLVYAAPANPNALSRNSRAIRERHGLLIVQKGGVTSEARDIRVARFTNEVCL